MMEAYHRANMCASRRTENNEQENKIGSQKHIILSTFALHNQANKKKGEDGLTTISACV